MVDTLSMRKKIVVCHAKFAQLKISVTAKNDWHPSARGPMGGRTT